MKAFFLIFATLFCFNAYSTDTLRMMHYNLLNYSNSTTYCDQTNNNLQTKEAALKIILAHVSPDIFTVNEVAANQLTANRLLGVVNASHSKVYAMGAYTNASSGDLANLLFYNTAKLTLVNQHAVATEVRDFNIFTLRYNSFDLQNGDTAFITCIVCHLKAGDSSEDEASRAQMVNTLMAYLSAHDYSGNITISGDFNLYSSSEDAYQSLVDASNSNIKFYDPVNKPGSWSNSSSYARYHTQSTHTSSNGCASAGGLDDRFDFILMTNSILTNTNRIEYLPSTYTAVGQTGTAFNGSILSMDNSLPYEVNQALYTLSDHLPVMADMLVHQTHVGIAPSATMPEMTVFSKNGKTFCRLTGNFDNNYGLRVFSVAGQKVLDLKILPQENFELSLNPGLYFLQAKTRDGKLLQKKTVVE